MPAFTQYGRPVSVACTTPAITVTDLTDLDVAFDPELIEHVGGASRFPRYTVGTDNTTISFTTTDVAALGFVKGMECSTIAAKFEGPDTVVNNAGVRTKTSGEIGLTLSNARVVEALRMQNDPTGKPGEIRVVLRAAVVESSGSDPTITVDVSMAS